ncbi:MAG: hypothetical protein JRJ87_08540 [Deltaproteobacteria bacterium]|nr:hypothetical protein [Deltaproteobacteria bacterium]
MKQIFWVSLACSAFVALYACDFKEFHDCADQTPYGDCWDDCRDEYGDCWDDDFDGGSDDDYYSGWCEDNSDCHSGEICAPGGQCMETVMNCPLTDECLPDPEGYVPDWQGIDPTYVGTFEADGVVGRAIVDIDFYEDHFYGEGWVELKLDDWSFESLNIVVTGTREDDQLWGQVVDPDARERSFDAVFTAQLLSASEIRGVLQVSSDDGFFEGEFALYRTSPCGCDLQPVCSSNADCPEGQQCHDGQCIEPDGSCVKNTDCAEGQVCLDGQCTVLCTADEDCPEGQICDGCSCIPACQFECCTDEDCSADHECIDNQCTPICEFECCADSDCPEGKECIDGACTIVCEHECCTDADCAAGDECVENTCLTPCELNCQCEADEVCQDGYCIIPDEEPPNDCVSDCDCNYDGGERCIDGQCQIP